ncbi:MAG: choice-of-anchor P family protein [Chloroflexota bacterium]
MVVFRLVLVAAIFVAANALTLTAPTSMAAVRVGGEAYGLAVGSPAVGAPGAAYVQLPPEGGSVRETSPGAGAGTGNSVGSTFQIVTTSDGDPGTGSVTSTAEVIDGELLGGVVRAHDIRVVASVTNGQPIGTVTFGSLIVAGVAYPNPAPNLRIDVPNVGIVIVNEQLVGGNGGGIGAIIVRAVRLQITEPSLFGMPRGTELILAHAAAGVPDVVASRPVSAGPTPTATPVPWEPISAYHPVDVSLNGNYDNGNDNDFEFDNGNGNDNGGGGTGTGGGAVSPTSAGIVITVIVVQYTPTPTPTP